jgi:mRNA interferase RelE/StbE
LTYDAVFLNVFLTQFKKLPSNESSRIKKRIKDLCDDPYMGLRLKGDLEGFLKDRVGNYRILYKIDDLQNQIIFFDVGLRKNIYD